MYIQKKEERGHELYLTLPTGQGSGLGHWISANSVGNINSAKLLADEQGPHHFG